MERNKSKEAVIRCPHCKQRLLDAAYVLGTIKCHKCKQIVKIEVEKVS